MAVTQREYEELNSRREAAGRPPLSYRDANRQARRPTTRQRQARQQGVGVEGGGTEDSSEARARLRSIARAAPGMQTLR